MLLPFCEKVVVSSFFYSWGIFLIFMFENMLLFPAGLEAGGFPGLLSAS